MSPFSGNPPSTDREVIWLALFDHLKATSSLSALIETFGRRLVDPPTLEQVQMPALFVLQVAEEKKAGPRRLPGKLILHGLLIIYVQEPATNESPGTETEVAATEMNAILKAVDDAFAPDGDGPDGMEVFTLGNLVSHCWIEGLTRIDFGIFQQQPTAAIPVHILVP